MIAPDLTAKKRKVGREAHITNHRRALWLRAKRRDGGMIGDQAQIGARRGLDNTGEPGLSSELVN